MASKLSVGKYLRSLPRMLHKSQLHNNANACKNNFLHIRTISSSPQHYRQTKDKIAGVSTKDYSCIPVQGSGTFAVDASFQTVLPRCKVLRH
ncbi:hypothetical protein Btru_012455 [Bulinus truncatus]|nr:hypothetical protein Btru_012455 [Bulinus truncatus]